MLNNNARSNANWMGDKGFEFLESRKLSTNRNLSSTSFLILFGLSGGLRNRRRSILNFVRWMSTFDLAQCKITFPWSANVDWWLDTWLLVGPGCARSDIQFEWNRGWRFEASFWQCSVNVHKKNGKMMNVKISFSISPNPVTVSLLLLRSCRSSNAVSISDPNHFGIHQKIDRSIRSMVMPYWNHKTRSFFRDTYFWNNCVS